MRFLSILFAALSLFSFAAAQGLITTTMTWDEGDTYVYSRLSTDADGETHFRTISTITATAAATTSTTRRTTTTSSSSSRATRRVTSSTTARAAATASTAGTTNADGVAVIPASGTQLDYGQFSSLVASPLSSAYYATVSSSANTRLPGWTPSSGLLVSLGVAVVGGAVGAAGFLL